MFFLPTWHEKSSSCAKKVMAACHWSASEQAAMAASAGGAACAGRSATGKMRKNNGRTRENREYMGTKTENHGKIWQNHHVQIIFGMENHGLTMYYWRANSAPTVQKYYTKAAVQETNAPQNQACKWKCYWIMLSASIWFSEVDSTWQIKIRNGTITTGNSGLSN